MIIKEKFPKTFKSNEQNYTFEQKLESQRIFFERLNVVEISEKSLPEIVRNMEEKKSVILKKEPWCKRGFGSLSKMFGRTLYSIVLTVKPELVIETGVACGISSSYILSALHENKKGKLISIDVESRAGEIVDNKLRRLWKLHIDKSQNVLPTLGFDRKIDMFFHDSDHSYKNMMWEFEWIYPRLSEGGIIISDDISFNNSIFDFAERNNEEVFFIRTSSRRIKAGAIIKGTKTISKKPTLDEVFGGN